ncbi:MAG: hypothetical protein IT251_03525 [Chitinophagaceae bacterium]|nr:hypothetical protein [Chitinophagaceae bacterium]
MPKTKSNTNRNVKNNHIFRQAYKQKMDELKARRKKIIKLNGWSQAAFYRKMNGSEQLTENELNVIIDILK